MKNVILCGFMGSGKSSVGMALSGMLGLEFIDMDDYIEGRRNMKIPDIFETFGDEYFRGLERAAAAELAQRDGIIVASGGGALTRKENVEAFSTNGVIVFLNAGFDECYVRIEKSDRPIVKRSTREQLEKLYNERAALYRSASVIEIASAGTPNETAEAVIERLKKFPHLN